MKAARKREVIAFQADKALTESMDLLAARQHRSRSDVIRQALLAELEKNGLVPIAVRAAV